MLHLAPLFVFLPALVTSVDAAESGPRPERTLTLDEALHGALGANLEIQGARLDLEAARLDLQSARGAFDPDLSVSAEAGRSRSPTNDATAGVDVVVGSTTGWSVGLSQALPTGGSATLSWSEAASATNAEDAVTAEATADGLWLSLSQPVLGGAGPASALHGTRSAVLRLDAQRIATRAHVEQLALDVADAYWGLVAARENAELARSSVQIAEAELADTRERQAEGFAGSGDVLQVERATGVARQALVIAEADAIAAEARFARLLGIDAASRPHLVPTDRPTVPDAPTDVAASLQAARTGNATWLLARLAVDQAALDLRRARRSSLPDLDVNASLGTSGLATDPTDSRAEALGAENRSWGVGAELSVPLPARELRADASAARLDQEQARLDAAAAEQDLVLRVEAAVRAVERDRSRVTLAEQTLDAARQGLDADRELLKDGRGSTRDVIRSLESLQAAQVSELQAQIDLQASLLELARVEGRLLTDLGLAGG